ncbi:MAG: hypothetical protein ACR2PX_26750 [Endozoicomonas sp.]|uniref:hypothetical protein n=1 Tax=Endozoicomonas sp. TaxID=1892382 RepID=UPI003D9B0D3F
MSADLHGCTMNDQSGTVGIPDDATRQGLVDYLMEFDSDLAPIVGQQITLYAGSSNAMNRRVGLLQQRARTQFVSKILGGVTKECDLVAQGKVNGKNRGYLYVPDQNGYRPDNSSEQMIPAGQLRRLARQSNNTLTFTCTPPGSGYRIALDRDQDGVLNRDGA